MAYKIVLDSQNKLIEKDYTLLISNYIKKRLDDYNIENFLLRTNDNNITEEQKISIIKNKYGNGNNIIVISSRLKDDDTSGSEIIYALRNNDKLASNISKNIENNGQIVNKYYQLRDENNTINDSDYLINNTKNNQTIAIYYGNKNDPNDIKILENNYENIAEGIFKGIIDYIGLTYIPLNNNYYVVQKGDTLWKIASKFNTTVDNIKKTNNLSTSNLNIGQVIIINKSNDNITVDNSDFYTVIKGDSLYSIAKKYNTTVDNLKKLNNLNSNTLNIGQKLFINTNENPNEIKYIVQKGDSLWLLANKFDTTIEQIKITNNLSTNNLSIGQTLIIPTSSKYITYKVIKGDSLYSIAKKYNTTVNNLKKLNNLNSNTLNIGQKLFITT